MPDDNPLVDRPLPPRERVSGCAAVAMWIALAAVLTVALTTGLIAFLGWRISDDSRRAAIELADRFEKAFQFTPEVRVSSVVVVEATRPVVELVTAEKQFIVRHTWENQWLHSTKRVEIEATFTARAGFDLDQPFRLTIDATTGVVGADFPAPKLLSLGMGSVRVLRDEDGLWNKLTEADRTAAFKELEAEADRQAAASHILQEASAEAQRRVKELIRSRPSPTPSS